MYFTSTHGLYYGLVYKGHSLHSLSLKHYTFSLLKQFSICKTQHQLVSQHYYFIKLMLRHVSTSTYSHHQEAIFSMRSLYFNFSARNTLLNTLFSNTLSLRFSLNVSDQVSHSCRTTGKIIVLCILIFKFLDSKLEDKRFCTE